MPRSPGSKRFRTERDILMKPQKSCSSTGWAHLASSRRVKSAKSTRDFVFTADHVAQGQDNLLLEPDVRKLVAPLRARIDIEKSPETNELTEQTLAW